MPSARKSAKPQNHHWYEIRNVAGAVPTLELFGDIGSSVEGDPYWGVEGGAGTFKEFSDSLKALGNVPELRVEIHSCGGSVIEGQGIYAKLMEHPANKTAVIYGICASAATYPAMACQRIEISANSYFLIHNSTGICMGDAEDMRAVADSLEVCDANMAALYASRTGLTVEAIMAIMDQDTWMTGSDAVELGLADVATEPIVIDQSARVTPENFAPRILNAMPAEARVWFDSRALTTAKRFSNRTTPPPASAMTEAELKTAETKLKADQEALETSKQEAAVEAKDLIAAAEAEAENIRNAAKASKPEEPAKPLTAEDVQNIVTTSNKDLVEANTKLTADLADLRKLHTNGVVVAAGGAGSPITGVAPGGDQPVDFKNMTAEQLVAAGRKKLFDKK